MFIPEVLIGVTPSASAPPKCSCGCNGGAGAGSGGGSSVGQEAGSKL